MKLMNKNVQTARTWLEDALEKKDNKINLRDLSNLIKQGKAIPVNF
jgi:hypothetical protein